MAKIIGATATSAQIIAAQILVDKVCNIAFIPLQKRGGGVEDFGSRDIGGGWP